MSRVRRYFYVSGMRIPTGRGLVLHSDGTIRRVILPDEGVSVLDDADTVSADGSQGTITLKDLIGSDVTAVEVQTADGVFELPFDPTKARGRQGRKVTLDSLLDTFESLDPEHAAALALMQIEMMPKSAKSGASEARTRLLAAIPYLELGTLAEAIEENPDALAHADEEVIQAMFEHDAPDAAELAAWAVARKRGDEWSLSSIDAANRFATLVMCSPVVDEILKGSIAKRFISQVAKRALTADTELEMLATAARNDLPSMPSVMTRVLHKITTSNTTNDRELARVVTRYDYRSMPQVILDEQAFAATSENLDQTTVEEILTFAGDLVSQDAFEALSKVAPGLAIAEHPDRVTQELAASMGEIENALAQQRPDLLSDKQRRDYLLNPRRRGIAPSFAKTITDSELDMISKAEHQIRSIVDDGAVAPMLINRLIGPRRSLALAMVVADLKENIQLGHNSMDFIQNREERRLVEDALASTDPITREEVVDGLTRRNRFDGLFIASQLTITQLHSALIDAASRIAVLQADHSEPRAALQSFVSRTDALLSKAGRDDRTALSSGLAYASELLSGQLDGEFSKQFQPVTPQLLSIDAQALDTADSQSVETLEAEVVEAGIVDEAAEVIAELVEALVEEAVVPAMAISEGELHSSSATEFVDDSDNLQLFATGSSNSGAASNVTGLLPYDYSDEDLIESAADLGWIKEYEENIARYFKATADAINALPGDHGKPNLDPEFIPLAADETFVKRVDTDAVDPEQLEAADLATEAAQDAIEESDIIVTAPAPVAPAAMAPGVMPAQVVLLNGVPGAVMTNVIPTVGVQLAIEIRVVTPETGETASKVVTVDAASLSNDAGVTIPVVIETQQAPASPVTAPATTSILETQESLFHELAPVQEEPREVIPASSDAIEAFIEEMMETRVDPDVEYLNIPELTAEFQDEAHLVESPLARLIEEQNQRDAVERAPQVQMPVVQTPAPAMLPASTVTGAQETAMAEYTRLKDEEAVFTVMLTSSKKKSEIRFATKSLKDVEKKIARIEKLLTR
jgi:hypothetical protein